MRIVLERTVDRRYLAGLNEWVSDAASARDFASTLDALLFCFAWHLHQVQIVVVFNNPQMNFALPVADAG